MNKRDCLTEWTYRGLIALLLFFCVWIACQTPYTHDDWDWGLPIGMQHLLTADLNSRYAGNLIVVLLTRSELLKTVFMGLVFTLLPVVCTELVSLCTEIVFGQRAPVSMKIALLLFGAGIFFSLSDQVWCQTNGWVAGFSNYVVSGLALVCFFSLLAKKFSEDKSSLDDASAVRKGLRGLGTFFFGLVIQLFLENLTLFFFFCSLLFFLFAVGRDRKLLPAALPLLGGCTVGLLLMFSSNIYHSLWETGYAVNNYRKLMFDRSEPLAVFLKTAAIRYFGEFVTQSICSHCLLAAFLSLLLCCKGVKRALFPGRPGAGEAGFILLGVINALFSVYYVYLFFNGIPSVILNVKRLFSAFNLLFFLLVTGETFLLFSDNKKLRFCLLVLWFSPVVMMLPMLLVNTVGPRCYYSPFLCLLLYCELLTASELFRWKGNRRAFVLAFCAVLVLLSGRKLGKMYAQIGVVHRQRIERITQAKEGMTTSIALPRYPYPAMVYLWNPEPDNPERLPYFRAFYGIPEEVTLTFVSFPD